MEVGVGFGLESIGNVGGGKGSAVGEADVGAQVEGDGFAIWGDFPGIGQRGFGGLGEAVDADEGGGGEFSERGGVVFVCLEGIESFGVGCEGEAEFRLSVGAGKEE